MGQRRRGDLVPIRGLKPGTPEPLYSLTEGQGLTRSCFFCACSSIFCFMLSFRCCLGSFSTSFLTCTRDSRAWPGQGTSSCFLGAGPQPAAHPTTLTGGAYGPPPDCCCFQTAQGSQVLFLLRGVPALRTAPQCPLGQVSQPCSHYCPLPTLSHIFLITHPHEISTPQIPCQPVKPQ